MTSTRDGGNNTKGKQLDSYLREIDKADDELLSLKMSHMAACKAPRGRIRHVMAQAREAGENLEAFRTLVAAHRADRKIDKRIAELEADDRAEFESLQEALGAFGDTALGQAALKRAAPKDGASDKLRDLHG
jgi:hypothetical protein